ncbi:TPA: YopX family protein [Streptococcus suis]
MVVPKFRAWDRTRNEWSNSFFIYSEGGLYTPNYGFDRKHLKKRTDVYPIVKQERFILMQSTGLVDKNGQEIFEGDKIIYNRDDYTVVRIDAAIGLAFIKNGEKTSSKPLVDGMINFDRVEVIGNIYENPELMEVSDGCKN